jgi:hypothetical protein
MGRPPLRPENATLREGGLRQRRGRATEDKLAIPQNLKQPGVSYEWKRESTLGEEDPQYFSSLQDNGWEPVPLSEMPIFGRPGEGGVVRRGGQVLMKRPIELTREAKIEDYQIARQQVLGNNSKLMSQDPAAGMPNRGSAVKHDFKNDMPSDHAIVKSAVDRIQLDD